MKFQLKKMTFSHGVTFFMLFWLMNVLYVVPAIAQKVHVDGKSSTVEGTKRSVYLRESPKTVEEPRIEIVR